MINVKNGLKTLPTATYVIKNIPIGKILAIKSATSAFYVIQIAQVKIQNLSPQTFKNTIYVFKALLLNILFVYKYEIIINSMHYMNIFLIKTYLN